MLKFGTDGVRGVANADLTPELALALGRAAARVLGGQTEIQANGFGMPDMKVAVGFGRKARDDTAAVFPGSAVRCDDLTDEIGCTGSFRHGPSVASRCS